MAGVRCWDPALCGVLDLPDKLLTVCRCSAGFLKCSHSSGLADVLTRTLCGPAVRYNSSDKRKSRCVYAFVMVASLGGLHGAL